MKTGRSQVAVIDPMKTLVTGAGGLLGKEFAAVKRDGLEIVGLNRLELDVTNRPSVERAFDAHKPDVVVNCSVILNVDKCEADPELCFGVNRDGVRNLLEVIIETGRPATFVQISSSEVFGRVNDGEFEINGYTEDDDPRPVSNYQKSKAQAEEVVKKICAGNPNSFPRWFVVRAGWLYGQGRPTFVEQFIASLQKPEEMLVISDQWRSPTPANDFVTGLFGLLGGSYRSGIYHIVDEVKPGEATTLDVLEEIKNYLGGSARASFRMVSRKDLFKVPRAPSNVLRNTKLPKLPYWRDSLRRYLQQNRRPSHQPATLGGGR